MTKEQETIERLNRFKTIKVLCTKTFAMTTEQLKVLQEDIETVLTMLKEKDKYIKDANDITTEMSNDIKKLTSEIEKKDKIIDLMADELVEAHKWFYSEFDNFNKEDFIKYFANKVNSNLEN